MNTEIKTITINGVEYVERSTAVPAVIGEKRIIVADRGWVFVGDCTDEADGTVTILNARNIRYWGTTSGLGELADGPTSKTRHDPYGTVRCQPIIAIAVNKGW